jgi:hypothetical protein
MTAADVLDRATRAGVTLESREGGRLAYHGPAAAVAVLFSELAAHKADLLALLAGAPLPAYDEAGIETAESLLAYASYRSLIGESQPRAAASAASGRSVL